MNIYPLSDLGNAQRFILQHRRNIRYCETLGGWFIWDNHYWERDINGKIFELAKKTVKDMLNEAISTDNDDSKKRLIQFALQSQSYRSISAIVNLAKTDTSIVRNNTDFNKNKWLLNVRNGTIDLRTGEIREHRRGDMISYIINIEHNDNAKCDRFIKFLDEIMCDNKSLVGYVQRAIGYSATGDVNEHKLFIPYGGGSNGKSKLLNTIRTVLGPYAIQSPPDLLLIGQNERHPTELADLFGVRMVVAVETNKGIKFNEARVKQLTGGDMIRARKLYQDHFEFEPTHKMWLATNNRPQISDTGKAICRRLAEIPFKAQFDEDDPNTDKDIQEKLLIESQGILNWIIEGAIQWYNEGLGTPDEVKQAVSEYIEEMDVIKHFIDECCDISYDKRIQSSILYEKYKEWVYSNGEDKIRQMEFTREIERHGYPRIRASNGFWFRGIQPKRTGS